MASCDVYLPFPPSIGLLFPVQRGRPGEARSVQTDLFGGLKAVLNSRTNEGDLPRRHRGLWRLLKKSESSANGRLLVFCVLCVMQRESVFSFFFLSLFKQT